MSRPTAKGWPFSLRLRDERFNYPDNKGLDKRNPHRSRYFNRDHSVERHEDSVDVERKVRERVNGQDQRRLWSATEKLSGTEHC